MKYVSLHLENFRKFKDITIDFEQYGNEIIADNKWGKTTIADAIMFILVGKLYSGSSDLQSLKPLHDTSLKVAAELVIATGWDGSNPLFPEFVTLRKEYKEDWVTARGSTVRFYQVTPLLLILTP